MMDNPREDPSLYVITKGERESRAKRLKKKAIAMPLKLGESRKVPGSKDQRIRLTQVASSNAVWVEFITKLDA